MLQKKDFGNDSVSSLLIASVRTADVNSTGIDLKEHDGVLFIVSLGNSADTLSGSVYIELEVETSDDNSAWVDAADADLSASVTGTNTGTFAKIDAPGEDSTVFTVAYLGRERYARVVVNVTGTHSTGTPVAVCAIRTRAKY